jgi:hypothetical protein
MKITGYALRDAIRQHELRRDTANKTFSGSLKAFPGETKMKPDEIMAQFTTAERAIARLQVAQMRYNLAVTVKISGEEMPLAEAIKIVGGLGRAEKMWKSATGPKEDRYSSSFGSDTRDPTQAYAVPTLTISEAVRLTSAAGKRSGAVRAAIATANAREVEIENLEASLFE